MGRRDEAETLQTLENNLREALKNFHGLTPNEIVFAHRYDP